MSRLFPDQLYSEYDHAKNKDENGKPVYSMHIFYKPRLWPVRIWFINKQVFAYLSPDTHKIYFESRIAGWPASSVLKCYNISRSFKVMGFSQTLKDFEVRSGVFG